MTTQERFEYTEQNNSNKNVYTVAYQFLSV